MKQKNEITESIFDNGVAIIPMADVSHIEYQIHPQIGKNGIMVITKHTRWDMDADTWSNACYIAEKNKEDFIKCFCRYRNELEGISETDEPLLPTKENEIFKGTLDELKKL